MRKRCHTRFLQPILHAPAIRVGIIVDLPPDIAILVGRACNDGALIIESVESNVLTCGSSSYIEFIGGYLDSISYGELVGRV